MGAIDELKANVSLPMGQASKPRRQAELRLKGFDGVKSVLKSRCAARRHLGDIGVINIVGRGGQTSSGI
jgi:hypothetical protein